MGQLLQAEVYARDTNRPPLQFAVPIEALISAGLTPNDLRWLVAIEQPRQWLEAVVRIS